MYFSPTAVGSSSPPPPVMGVAAPMEPPGAMTMSSHASEIRAPAEIARGWMKATVRIGASMSASRMSTAASTRPPKVSMSRSTTAPSTRDASSTTRATNGAIPRSTVPSMGTRNTIDGWVTGWGDGDSGSSASWSPRTCPPTPRQSTGSQTALVKVGVDFVVMFAPGLVPDGRGSRRLCRLVDAQGTASHCITKPLAIQEVTTNPHH